MAHRIDCQDHWFSMSLSASKAPDNLAYRAVEVVRFFSEIVSFS